MYPLLRSEAPFLLRALCSEAPYAHGHGAESVRAVFEVFIARTCAAFKADAPAGSDANDYAELMWARMLTGSLLEHICSDTTAHQNVFMAALALLAAGVECTGESTQTAILPVLFRSGRLVQNGRSADLAGRLTQLLDAARDATALRERYALLRASSV